MTGDGGLIDAHVHAAALGPGEDDGFASPRMWRGWLGLMLRLRLGVRSQDPALLSRVYRERLEAAIAGSRRVRAFVVLALDGVYDPGGRLDRTRTHLYVPNRHVLDLARGNPRILPGASVNPRRRDALDELARVAAEGAVLCKWLPNTQGFDPADPLNLPFFRRLAELRLPLLVHSGMEAAVLSSHQAYGHPHRWQPALDHGVEVIAAHAGSSGYVWERHARAFFALLEGYPNLHADSSALLTPGRMGMLGKLRRAGHLGRLTFGTDFPLPSFAGALLLRLRPRAWAAVAREANYFDRQVRLFEALGWPPSSTVLERLIAARGPVS